MAKGFIKIEIDGTECKLEMRGAWSKIELVAAAAKIVDSVAQVIEEKASAVAEDIRWAIASGERSDEGEELDHIIDEIIIKNKSRRGAGNSDGGNIKE